MKKEEILRMASTVFAGILSNPVMSGLCSPVDSGPRSVLFEKIIDEITFMATKIGLKIEE